MVSQNRENLKLGQASRDPRGKTKRACIYSKILLTANGHGGEEKGREGKLETAKLDKKDGLGKQSFCWVELHYDFQNQKCSESNIRRAW